MNTLNVWKCKRHGEEDWRGALVVAATDVAEAIAVFRDKDNESNEPSDPAVVTRIEGVFADGKPRVLYNDFPR